MRRRGVLLAALAAPAVGEQEKIERAKLQRVGMLAKQ